MLARKTSSHVPRRRRLAVSVRTTMLVVLILAAGLAQIARRARTQRQAVARINQAGGSVGYDFPFSLVESSWSPEWLKRLETVTVSYCAPDIGASSSVGANAGERVFAYQGANPNTRPRHAIITRMGDPDVRSSKNPNRLPLPGDIATMSIAEIDSARSNAELEVDPDSKPDLDARAYWARLVRRESYWSPWQPEWLRQLIGDDLFRRVTSAFFSGRAVTDESLTPVEDLRHVRRFMLFSTPDVTDAGLAHLRYSTELQIADLWEARVTGACFAYFAHLDQLRELKIRKCRNLNDAGLSHLARLTQLRVLSLLDSKVTDGSLEHIGRLVQLRDLDLSGTEISGTGLAHLAGLVGLRKLDISETRVSGGSLAKLRGLTELEELDLARIVDLDDSSLDWLEGLKKLRRLAIGGSIISDAGLKRIAGLSALEELDLAESRITDAGLLSIRSLRNLRKLYVGGTRVSPERAADLRNAMPGLVVSERSGTKFGAY
jgi:hypothetical protein